MFFRLNGGQKGVISEVLGSSEGIKGRIDLGWIDGGCAPCVSRVFLFWKFGRRCVWVTLKLLVRCASKLHR